MTLIEPVYIVQWFDNEVLRVFDSLKRAQEFVAHREPRQEIRWAKHRAGENPKWIWKSYIISKIDFEHNVSSLPSSSHLLQETK